MTTTPLTPTSTPSASPVLKPSGWLLLFHFGLVVGISRNVFSLIVEQWPALHSENWLALTTPGSADYHPLWAPLFGFEVAQSALMIVLAFTVLVALAMRRRAAPKLAVTMLVIGIAMQALDLALGLQIPQVAEQSSALFGAAAFYTLISLAWIAYFLRSTRVKALFA